jgi:hypothetical protein
MARWLVRLLSQEAGKWSGTSINSGICTVEQCNQALCFWPFWQVMRTRFWRFWSLISLSHTLLSHKPHPRYRSNRTINIAFAPHCRIYLIFAPTSPSSLSHLPTTAEAHLYLTVAPTYHSGSAPLSHCHVVITTTREPRIDCYPFEYLD